MDNESYGDIGCGMRGLGNYGDFCKYYKKIHEDH